jgi:hypothetical protein
MNSVMLNFMILSSVVLKSMVHGRGPQMPLFGRAARPRGVATDLRDHAAFLQVCVSRKLRGRRSILSISHAPPDATWKCTSTPNHPLVAQIVQGSERTRQK